MGLPVRQVFASTLKITTEDNRRIGAPDRHFLSTMFVSTALSVVALGLSAVALPTDSSLSNNLPAVGSMVNYSDLPMQPLQDASSVNGNMTDSEPLSGDIARLRRRQDIDFDLVDSTPDPTVAPNNYTDYNRQAAINAVVADISSDPLPQKRDALGPRDTYTTAPSGYSSIIVPSSAALNAPLNCNGADTFIGSKLFNSGPFDESLCAAACTAQSAYNSKHPPSSGSPKLCQYYNTYVLLKDGVSQGQYW